jgi:hypothetical protein
LSKDKGQEKTTQTLAFRSMSADDGNDHDGHDVHAIKERGRQE